MEQFASTARPWTRWWWMGNAVTKQEITRHLIAYRKAGIGGVEITPIYGVKGCESLYVQMFSPAWIELIRHAIAEGRRLGIGVDMTLGSGWPYGGPHVTGQHAPLKLELVEEDGRWILGSVPTGQQVKRPAPGGAGNVMCPFTREAFDRFITPYTKMFADGPRPRCAFYDSFEVYGTDFAIGLLDSFKQLKGYELTDHLAALAGRASPEEIGRVRCDYRDVLFTRLLEDGIKPWVQWTASVGVQSRYQAHGAPGNLLDLYATADIPETEVFGTNAFPSQMLGPHPEIVPDEYVLVNKMASSAAHLSGKRLVSSETFTWHREHFCGSLAEMKPELDQLFLAGINHIFFHGSTYSPVDAIWPGWLFYASTHFDPTQPIWRDISEFNSYIEYCQRLFQDAQVSTDCLVYFPFHDVISTQGKDLLYQLTVHNVKDWIGGMEWGRVAMDLWRGNIGFDFVSDALLEQATQKVVVIPPCNHMPLATLRRLLAMVHNAGVTVIVVGEGPTSEPGMAGLHNREQFEAVRAELMSHCLQVKPEELLGVLQLSDVRPLAPKGLKAIRLRRSAGDCFFIANLSANDFQGWFPVPSLPKERVWTLSDPIRGRFGIAERNADRAFLQLRRGESIWLSACESWAGRWVYLEPTGKELPIRGQWDVTAIKGGEELPPPMRLNELASWTELSPQWRDFSGTASYRIEFEWKNRTADVWMLCFPQIGDSMRVRMNNIELGTLWCAPFEVEVPRHVQREHNVLVCEVTNAGINRIAAMDRAQIPWRIFHDINLVDLRYKPFDASNWPARPSGILATPVLRALQRRTFAQDYSNE